MNRPVLIVDDSLTIRMDLSAAFADSGIDALAAASITEARAVLAEKDVGLLVLDVVLPDGDGVDFLAELRGQPERRDMPVVMLSTEADVKDRIRGLQKGADEYVGKPYDVKQVVGAVRRLCPSAVRTREPTPAGLSVLLIDDSLTFREAMGETFRDAGYAVVTAESGEEGLGLVADRRPDVVIADRQLPGMDGSTVIRRIRLDAALRDIPCVLLTGSDDAGAELEALEAGADAFLRKQEPSEVVLARIAAVLRRSSPTTGERIGSLQEPRKVLAVDDSRTFLEATGDMLREEGYDVVKAESGEEALELLAVQPVDCILLDLMMPGMGGHEACRRIKAAPVLRDTPLILLTAVEDSHAMLEGLGAGADDYISKSSEFEVLKARVRAQIRRKQFEDENRRIREELLRRELSAAEARAAQELAETRAVLVAELERKNRELEAFSYSVSHDLRAPLRAIDGFSLALIEDCGDQLDQSAHRYLERVRNAAQRMGQLIDDMLQLSRVTRQELRRQEVDVSALARETAEALQQQHPEHAVAMRIEPGLTAEADPRLLRIVLENLIGNAWKFTRRAESPVIELGARAGEDGVFFVRDNGAGFDAARADKLFTPFQRFHSEADFPGTGIGLATIHRVVDRHGGRVWAESEVGKGATFFFTLPTATAAAAVAA